MIIEWLQRVFSAQDVMAAGALLILVAFLLAAAWSDLQRKRIPNSLVWSGSLLALLLHTVLPAGDGFLSGLPGGLGFLGSLKGLVFGLFVLYPFYSLRVMGAGDVKLLAMVGAFLGPSDFWWALFSTLLAGGGLAIAVALHGGMLGNVLKNLRLMFRGFRGNTRDKGESPHASAFTSIARLPYGVAIATGSIATMIYRLHLFDHF